MPPKRLTSNAIDENISTWAIKRGSSQSYPRKEDDILKADKPLNVVVMMQEVFPQQSSLQKVGIVL
jgi:hypothetical protein